MQKFTIGNLKRWRTYRMSTLIVQKELFLKEIEKLHYKNELSKSVSPDYFEPGMMEYLEQWDGIVDKDKGIVILRFEARGTRYEGRTEQIERVKIQDEVQVIRDEKNPYNSNNFLLLTKKGKNIGNMPAELCNVIAPLYDVGELTFEEAVVSFVEPISKRNRHAKQAILFVELRCRLTSK